MLWPDAPLECLVSLGSGTVPSARREKSVSAYLDTGSVLIEARSQFYAKLPRCWPECLSTPPEMLLQAVALDTGSVLIEARLHSLLRCCYVRVRVQVLDLSPRSGTVPSARRKKKRQRLPGHWQRAHRGALTLAHACAHFQRCCRKLQHLCQAHS